MKTLRQLRHIPIIFSLFAAALLAAPLASAQQSTPDPQDPLRTITVSGTGRVTTTPDAANIAFGIEATNDDLKPAQDEVTQNATSLTAMLKEQGIEEKDIQTAHYEIAPIPEYDRDGNYVGVEQYQVRMAIVVTVNDLDTLGTLMDLAVDNGATYVGGVSMFVSDPDPLISQARQAAMEDARTKAEEYATGANAEVVAIISVDETSSPMPTEQEFAAPTDAGSADMSEERAAPVPVSPGETEIIVTVYTVWQIQPAAGN